MTFDTSTLSLIAGMMILSNRLVAALITPLFEEFKLKKFCLMYVAWFLSGVLVFATGTNAFAGVIQSDILGKILTAIIAGGGANILHDLTDRPEIAIGLVNDKTEKIGDVK